MVCFMVKNGDTAIIKIICGKQSKMNAAITGGDFINLDSAVNDANQDNNIKHIGALISYYEDEDEISNKLKSPGFMQLVSNNNSNNNTDKKSNKKDINKEKKNDENDWTCPECNSDDCLKDKHGNKYPCISCLQIDIGQKILREFGDKVNKTLNVNNNIIDSFIRYIKSGNSEENKERN